MGSIFLTTLTGNRYDVRPDTQRIYDSTRFNRPIEWIHVENQEYYIFRKKWIPVEKEKAFKESPDNFVLAYL